MFTFIFRGYDCGNCKNFSYKIKASNKQDAINKGFEKLRKNGGNSISWECELQRF